MRGMSILKISAIGFIHAWPHTVFPIPCAVEIDQYFYSYVQNSVILKNMPSIIFGVERHSVDILRRKITSGDQQVNRPKHRQH